MSKLLARDDDKAQTAGWAVGAAAYHLLKLSSYSVTTAVICGVCLSMLVGYTCTENRRVSLPKWLLLTAFAGLNIYSYHFLNGILSLWLPGGLAQFVAFLTVGGTLLAMPEPTGEGLLGRFLGGRSAAKALPPSRP